MSKKINISKGWKFLLGDLAPQKPTDEWGGAKAKAYNFGAVKEDFDDNGWRTVDVPHDFVVEGDYTRKNNMASSMQDIPEMESMDSRHFAGGSLEGGVAWYRRKFDTPEGVENKRVYLCFDGVYRDSTVYVNEYYVGSHAGGYTSFYYDITDFLHKNGQNTVAVRVDSTGREGWWYEGGGIYRDVWVEVMENVYIEKWGTFAASEVNLSDNSAKLTIKTEIVNKNLQRKFVTVKSEIIDPNGNGVAEVSSGIDVAEWDKDICVQQVHLDAPQLWDLESPNLYTLKTTLLLGDEIADAKETTFGIRDIRFDADEGLFLNGKHIRVQGLCFHHDHAGVGIGMTEELWERRIKKIKEMGANGYRSAHHPPTEAVLELCDRLGILVLDETRRMSSASDDLDALRMMVKRDRNHPSVFLWGIGNEEIFSQDNDETERVTVTMKAEVRKLDNTRPVTSAVVCWNRQGRFDNAAGYVHVTKNLDVMGFNYCKTAWDDYHKRMPKQPMIITEASANSGTRGCYSTDEKRGQYYILDPDNLTKCKNGQKATRKDMAEGEWKYFAERPYLSGIFLWTGADYRGEPTPLTYPAISSQFGILDYCGFEKDNFYYYKSWWSGEDVLHVFPHWNHNDGEVLTVHCYSNLDEVEIFVNGRSYGKKTMEKNRYLSWENVAYEKGELKAVGYRGGKAVLTDTIKTTGEPYAIVMKPYKDSIKSGETAVVEVSVVGKNGAVVPTADNEICFDIDGELVGVGNGNPGDHASDKAPVRRAFNGKCLVMAKKNDGEIKIKATAAGIKSAECIIIVR